MTNTGWDGFREEAVRSQWCLVSAGHSYLLLEGREPEDSELGRRQGKGQSGLEDTMMEPRGRAAGEHSAVWQTHCLSPATLLGSSS
jgi:hypothetical protein